MILTGKINLDKWNQIAWFVSDETHEKYKAKNAKFKVEKVYVPAFSEALISKCYIDGQDISNDES